MHESLGTVQQFTQPGSETDPLIRLPPTHQWTLKEAEVYYEFRDVDAALKVAAISGLSRSLARTFNEYDYGDTSERAVPGVRRDTNMPSVHIGLGAENVYLAIYAKASERIRLEVRYKRYPLRACRLDRASFTSRDTFVRDVLVDIIANATRRMNRFLSAYRSHQSDWEAGLVPLVSAVSCAASSSGANLGVLNRVLALLITHGGLSRCTDPRMQAVIDALVSANILRQVETSLRPSASEFALTPLYATSFRRLREMHLVLGPPRQAP